MRKELERRGEEKDEMERRTEEKNELERLRMEKCELISYGLDQEERLGQLQVNLENLEEERNLVLERVGREKGLVEINLEKSEEMISGLESSIRVLRQERENIYQILTGTFY